MKSKIIQKNKARRELTAPILIPDVVDHHGDTYNSEEVLKACRNFEYNNKQANLQHQYHLDNEQARWVENYTTAGETIIKSSDGDDEIVVPEGTWMGTLAVNEEIWKPVLAGKYTGFSIQCRANTEDILKALKLGETRKKPTTRLSEFDFSGEDHAVALVDKAANATEILVMKAHKPKVSKGDDENNPGDPGQTNKDNNMTIEQEVEKIKLEKVELEKQNAQYKLDAEKVELEKSEAISKSQNEANEKATANSEELEKSKTKIEDLEKFKKEADEKSAEVEKSVMVTKAKNLKVDDEEVFVDILIKCKDALEEDQFETLEKQLCKPANIKNSKDLLKSVGDGSVSTEGDKSQAEVAYAEVCKSVSDSDPKLKQYEVRNLALGKFKAQDREAYDELFSN